MIKLNNGCIIYDSILILIQKGGSTLAGLLNSIMIKYLMSERFNNLFSNSIPYIVNTNTDYNKRQKSTENDYRNECNY